MRLLLIFFFGIIFFSAQSQDGKAVRQIDVYRSLDELEDLKLSHEPGIYNHSIKFSITGNRDAYIFELLGDKTSRVFFDTISITKPSYIRIRKKNIPNSVAYVGYYLANFSCSLPVVALVVEDSAFFPPSGIYEGTVEAANEAEAEPGGEPTAIVKGKAWEKKPITAYAQFIFNHRLQDELQLDLKTYGGMTLGWKEKSLQLSARKEKHGRGKIKVKLFEDLPFREFQHVVLRTSGNDQGVTRLKDRSISHLAADLKLDIKASRAAVIYINGIYWGIHNLREKINEDYFKERFNWKEGEFVELQGSGLDDSEFAKTYQFIEKNVFTDSFLSELQQKVDVENLFNFQIFQTFINNPDYRGNIRFYKHKEGTWKWIVYDTDLGCNYDFMHRNFIADRLQPQNRYWYNPQYATGVMEMLLKNKALRTRFVNQYAFLLASVLRSDNFHKKVDRNKMQIEPEIERHFLRRGRIYWEKRETWERNIEELKLYFNARYENVYSHLASAFNLEPTFFILNASQNYSHFKGLTMNGSSLKVNEIKGLFFKQLPIELHATNANHLYSFVKWSDGKTPNKRILNTSDNLTLKAQYVHKKESPYRGKISFRKYFVNNNWKNPLVFCTIINSSEDTIDIANMMLYEDISGDSITLGVQRLSPGEELVFANNPDLFFQLIDDKKIKVQSFLAEQTFLNEAQFCIIDSKNKWIDSLYFSISDSLQIEHAGFLVEKINDSLSIKEYKIKNLRKLNFSDPLIKKRANKSFLAAYWRWLTLFCAMLVLLWGVFYLRNKRKTYQLENDKEAK
jgi:hypothetical protein